MAFEKCKELYSVLSNASDFLEHADLEETLAHHKYIEKVIGPSGKPWYKYPSDYASGVEEKGKGEDADGVDEYGAYHLKENGEKAYDLGDGIEYDYTDGYFRPRNNPNAPMKKWDEAIGAYVDAAPPEEEKYPDVGEEDKPKVTTWDNVEIKEYPKTEKTIKEDPVKEKVIKEKVLEEERTSDPHLPETPKKKSKWKTAWEKVKAIAKGAYGKAKTFIQKIRDKLKHGEVLDDDEIEFLAHCGIDLDEADEFLAHCELALDGEDDVLIHDDEDDEDSLEHHGIFGQRWGKRNGPPYPLKRKQHSLPEKGAEYVKKEWDSKDVTELFRTVGTVADTSAKVYSTIVPPKPYGSDSIERTLRAKNGQPLRDSNGQTITIDDVNWKIDHGIPLSQAEIDAVNSRNSHIQTLNSNYKSPADKKRDKVLKIMNSASEMAVSAIAVANFIQGLKKSGN